MDDQKVTTIVIEDDGSIAVNPPNVGPTTEELADMAKITAAPAGVKAKTATTPNQTFNIDLDAVPVTHAIAHVNGSHIAGAVKVPSQTIRLENSQMYHTGDNEVTVKLDTGHHIVLKGQETISAVMATMGLGQVDLS